MPLIASRTHRSKIMPALVKFALIPAVGIACFRLTAWTLYSNGLGIVDPDLTFISRVMQACVILLALVIDRRVAYSERSLLIAVGIAAFGMSAGGLLPTLMPETIYVHIGYGINGSSSAIVMLGWGYYFCSREPRYSALCLTLAFALFSLTTWALSGISGSWLLALTILAPFVSFVCLRLSVHYNEKRVTADTPLTKSALSSLPWGMFALLGICTIISILAKVLVPMGEGLRTVSYRWFWPLIFFALFLLFFFWCVVFKRKDPDRLWPVFVLVIFSGLLFYTSFSSTQPEFAALFLRATQECLMLFCWVVTASLVYSQNLPRVFSFGLSTFVFVVPPTLVAGALSLLFPSVASTGDETATITVIALMAFVLIVLTVVLISTNAFVRTRNSDKDDRGTMQDPLPIAIENLAQEYDLTTRESEVALHLAKGYTLAQTADNLCISLDTVRSHVKRLYRKMNIHKKQDLIAVIEGKRDGR